MKKHRYCCQNAVQNYLDHIISIPDNIKINPCYLFGLSNDDFIVNLNKLSEIIKQIYQDIIQNPDQYGLPLIDDIEYSPFNPKAAESKNSSHRLVALLHSLVNSGDFSDGKIVVDRNLFSLAIKSLKSINKVTNISMILSKLVEFGFICKNFDKKTETFYFYHSQNEITTVLYGYLLYKVLNDFLFSFNYNLIITEEDLPHEYRQKIFAQYLKDEERDFYIELNDFLMKEKFIIGNSPDFRFFSMEYLIDLKDEKRIVRCYTDFGKLKVSLKLHNSDKYADYIESLPEKIKNIFRKKSSCKYCNEHCNFRLFRKFEDQEYTDCGYGNYFDISKNNLDDLDYYKQIILLETAIVKNHK